LRDTAGLKQLQNKWNVLQRHFEVIKQHMKSHWGLFKCPQKPLVNQLN